MALTARFRAPGLGICSHPSQRRLRVKSSCGPNGTVSTSSVSDSDMDKLRRTTIALSEARAPPKARFKVLQWNILADGLAQSGDFIKVPSDVLEWRFRMPLILEELAESEADIICLQEVNHFDELLLHLSSMGYAGGFFPKPCSPAERYNCPADGLAIFFSESRFKLVEHFHGQAYSDSTGHQQSQCFLYARLRDLREERDLVVCTTHLKAKEGEAENQCRMLQMRQLLSVLNPLLEPTKESNGESNGNGSSKNGDHPPSAPTSPAVPVILTGDFNTTPFSPPCQELMAHPAGFQSIWDVCPMTSLSSGSVSDSETKEFSTWKFRSKGESKRIIDHLWYTNGEQMAPVSRWRMLNEDEIGPSGLPTSSYASDHQALCCEFEWRNAA